MQADLYLKNGQVVTETAVFPGGVAIKNGRIAPQRIAASGGRGQFASQTGGGAPEKHH
ncbi:MAG: hypothetical protein H6668_20125 [Ardenticatenaceae bacterium]|nr:hypothetical protein [Ardenticatenaceae bacterium]